MPAVLKKFFGSEFFGKKKFFGPKIIWTQILMDLKICWPQNLRTQNISDQKCCVTQNYFIPKLFSPKSYIWPKHFVKHKIIEKTILHNGWIFWVHSCLFQLSFKVLSSSSQLPKPNHPGVFSKISSGKEAQQLVNATVIFKRFLSIYFLPIHI